MKKWLLMLTVVLAMSLVFPALAEGDRFAFDKSVTSLFEGDTLQTVLERAGNAREGTLTFKSSAPHIATVDANGLVTGVSKGRVSITATLKNGKRTFTCSISLAILRQVETVALKSEHLNVFAADDPLIAHLVPEDNARPVLLLPPGRSYTLQSDVQPSTASDRTVIYTSSDEAVLTVRGKVIKTVAPGTCVLTVASKQNPEVCEEWLVIVAQPITGMKLIAASSDLYVGDMTFLFADITPADATLSAVTWKSENEKVAVVDAFGTVTALSRGYVTLRATALDGSGRYATINLQVKQKPEAITLSESEMTLAVGSPKNLKATVAPQNADEKALVWSSSDESVATVNSQGRVTPVAPGSCVITCESAAFSGVNASCTVNVYQPVTKVAFPDKTASVNVGETITVFWQTSPDNATNPAVSFSSSNEKIATVDAYGNVYGVKRGSCTITATAKDGSGKRGTIKVNVLQPVTGVHMYSDTIMVGVGETEYGQAVLEPADASNNRMTWTSADPDVAEVSGNRNKPAVTGIRWGETTITGITEDGGYTTTATVKVGNFDRAVKITDLYLQDNRIKIVVVNDSNMTITRINFTMEVYDEMGHPLPCTKSGSHTFKGSYSYTLYEGDATRHGKFYFNNFVQPEESIGRVVMTITGYATDEGYARTIRESRQVPVEYLAPTYVGENSGTEIIIQYK